MKPFNLSQHLTRSPVYARDEGCKGDGLTNDTATMKQAVAKAKLLGRRLVIEGGPFILDADGQPSGGVNFAGSGLEIIGHDAVLKYVGNGRAFVLDQGGTAGQFLEHMLVEGIQVFGGAGVTDGFYMRGIVRSAFRNLKVLDIGGKAFHIKHGVSNHYDCLTYSALQNAPTIRRPGSAPPLGLPVPQAPPALGTHGIYLDNNDSAPALGYYTADCTFTNPIMENFPGIGIEIRDGAGNRFTGGTCEGVTTGLKTNLACERNVFAGLWCEANTGEDAIVDGHGHGFSQCYFGSSSPHSNVQISATATGTFFDEGTYLRIVNTAPGSLGTSFHQCAVDQSLSGTTGFQDVGPITRIACTKVDGQLKAVGLYPDIFNVDKGEKAVTLVAATSGTITLNPSFQSLFWTKRGNRVEYSGLLFIAAIAAPLGEIRLKGLAHVPPPGPLANNRASGSIAITAPAAAGGVAWQVLIQPGVDYVQLQRAGGASMAPDLAVGTNIFLSFSFPTEI